MTDKIKLKADKFVNDKKLKLNYIKPKDLKILLAEFCKEQIVELKAECDLAIEGRDIRIAELTEQNTSLLTSVENLNKSVQELDAQIEKMKTDVKQGQSYWNSGEMQYDLYQRLLDKWEIKE